MTKEEFDSLGPGDMVMSVSGGPVFLVMASYGDRVTAARTFDMTNPNEYVLIRKVQTAPGGHLIPITEAGIGEDYPL